MLRTLLAGTRIWAGIRAIGSSLPRAQQYPPIRVTGLTKTQAEDLLDWLDANGYRDRHLDYIPGEGFAISYSKSRPLARS